MEEFLIPMRLTQQELGKAIHVPDRSINELVNRRKRLTLSVALRLAKYFGVSADFWMNLQLRWDLYFATKSENKSLKVIQPYTPTRSVVRQIANPV